MPRVAFADARVVTPSGLLDDGYVVCEGEQIHSLGQGEPSDVDEVVDCAGEYLAPGAIDVHIHGAAGAMVEEATPEAITTVAQALPQYGVTGFLPTFATSPLEAIHQGFSAVREAAEVAHGARVLGVHLEGPYISPECAGAQPRRFMRQPDMAEARRLLEDGADLVKLVTLAPELQGAIELIQLFRQAGAVVSAGHTNATASEIAESVEAGVSHATHLFNAMRGIHHREPGAAGALLADDRVTCELICDGHHVHQDMLALALRCKPRDRAVLVTDAVAPLGWGDGEYELFNVRCVLSEGTIRLAENGALAGSVLSMDAAIRNLVSWFPTRPLHEWWRYASSNPAQELGEAGLGRIEVGAQADIVRYTPELTVRETYIRGARVYAADQVDAGR